MSDPHFDLLSGSIPLEIRVLVAGHDSSRLSGHDDAVRICITQVVETIQAAIHAVNPDCAMSLLSGSAEGTDAMACAVAREQGYVLSVLTHEAVPRLSIDASRVVGFGFDSSRSNPTYEAEATAIRDAAALQFSDLVVAVWDGNKREGRSERTAGILRRALLAHKCVIWIEPADKPVCRVTNLPDLAKVDWLSLPEDPDSRALMSTFVTFTGSEDTNLRGILNVLLSELAEAHMRKLLASVPRRSRPGLIDRVFRAVVTVDTAPLTYAPRRSLPIEPTAPTSLFEASFAQADIAANLAGGDYRSRVWMLYVFSALAVAFGALDLTELGGGSLQNVWRVAEPVALVSAFSCYFRGGRQLHRRWTDLRNIAELLRYQHFVYSVAGAIAPLRQSLWTWDGAKARSRDNLVMLLHRLNVAAGLPVLEKGSPFDVSRALLFSNLPDELVEVIDRQKKYHRNKQASENVLHRRLETVSTCLFILTVVAVVAKWWPHLPQLKSLWGLFVVSLPAFAAAIYGIGSQLELSRIAEQSGEQAASLARNLEVIGQVSEDADQDPWLAAIRLRRLVIEAADLMVREFSQWEALVLAHPLSRE